MFEYEIKRQKENEEMKWIFLYDSLEVFRDFRVFEVK